MLRLIQSLLLLTVILTSTSAAPTENQSLSFKVTRQATGKLRTRNAAAEVVKTYQKYGWPISGEMMQASTTKSKRDATASQQGTATATPNIEEGEYLTPVDIGGQQMMMDFDTGSSDL